MSNQVMKKPTSKLGVAIVKSVRFPDLKNTVINQITCYLNGLFYLANHLHTHLRNSMTGSWSWHLWTSIFH